MTSNSPRLSAIAAMSKNRVIGKNNQLPWHLPADLKRFKALTTGHPIIMGRKTYDSIGKPLPNRTNIILTRDPTFHAPGCLIAPSIEKAMQLAATDDPQECFIIGGAHVYQQTWPMIQCLYLTIVQQEVEGDAYFPEINEREWQLIEEESHEADEHNPYAYQFLKMVRG